MPYKLASVLLSLFLFKHNNAQTGYGCVLTTCDVPGQVRIDVKLNPDGTYAGGCNCACDPALADPQSPNFCEEPKRPNFDPNTRQGNCACECPPELSETALACVAPSVYDPSTCSCSCPSTGASASSCSAGQTFNPLTCSCDCGELGQIGQMCNDMNGNPVRGSIVTADCACNTLNVECRGNQVPDANGNCHCPEFIVAPDGRKLWLEVCELPFVRDPISCGCQTTTTTTPPPGPVSVTCTQVGDCKCPFGTRGACTLNCMDSTDACKDGIIECNNDGFDCIVNCLGGQSCGGSSEIFGPVSGSLTVNCKGGQACEGDPVIHGEKGYDMEVICEGGQACKGNPLFKFGTGVGSLACTGAPDSCQGIIDTGVTVPAGARAFSCSGKFCPSTVPAPFSNVAVDPIPQPQNSMFPQPLPGNQQAQTPQPLPQSTASKTPVIPVFPGWMAQPQP